MLKKLLSFFIGLMSIFNAIAQNTGNSPYSIFNIGDVMRSGFSYNRGMGGISTGLRKPSYINYLNPASYTSQDSMSFTFELGGSYERRSLVTSFNDTKSGMFNVDYLAGSFPVTRWWSACFGLVPFSRVGYNISQSTYDTPTDTNSTLTRYYGSGGINQAFIGNAFSFFNHVSVGFNISYLFGSINNNKGIMHPDLSNEYYTYENTSTRIGGFYWDLGLQYYTHLNDKFQLTAGFVYNQGTTINGKHNVLFYRTQDALAVSGNDTLVSFDTIRKITIPTNFGGGLSLNYDNRILVGLDVYRQNWAKVSYPVRFGIEITPVNNQNKVVPYFYRIHYRAGMQYTNSQFYVNGHDINDMRVSAGLGLPFPRSKNEFNISFEYGQRGTTANDLIRDKYMFVTFSFRLYEFWFYRRKYD